MKKMLCVICLLCLLFDFASALEPGRDVSAKSAVLYDPLTEKVLWGKLPDERLPMASTTKIMTALTALELYPLAKEIKLPEKWLGAEGSSMYLKPGETVTVEDLLYGLLLMSGNDAALILARALTGDESDFVALMNSSAADMGLYGTHFENPSGLDGAEHYTTALDLARLAARALDEPVFRHIVSQKTALRAGRHMKNHNKLLDMYPSVFGVKTGFTKRAGRCLVSAAEKNGRTLIAVTLSAPDDWNDHIALYDAAFGHMSEYSVEKDTQIASIPVAGGGECPVFPEEGFQMSLFPDEQIIVTVFGPRMLYAPVLCGDPYGTMVITSNGRELFSAELFCGDTFEDDECDASSVERGILPLLLEMIFGK